MNRISPSGSRDRLTTILVILAVSVFYLAAVSHHWAIEPDSAVYLTLGRSLAEGCGMEYNGAPSWGVPPGLPLLIAGSHLFFGDAYWPINLALTLLAIGTVILAYGVGKRLAPTVGATDVRLALGVLLVVGASARLFVDSTRILTDVPCTFFVTLGIYAFVRARQGHWTWCWAGLGAMLVATAIRLPASVLLAGVVAGVAMDVRRKTYAKRLLATLGVAAAVAAAAALGWWFFVRGQAAGVGPDYFRSLFERIHLSEWDRWVQLAEGLMRLPGALCEVFTGQELPWFHLVPTVLLGYGLWTAGRRRQWVVVFPVAAYVVFLLALGGSAVAPRYLLPALPMLAYLLLVGVHEAASRVLGWRRVASDSPTGTKQRRLALAVVVGFCMAVSLPKAAREVYRMRRPNFYETYERGRWKGQINLGRHLAERREKGLAAPTDRVLAPDAGVLHYLTGLRTDAVVCLAHPLKFLGYGPPFPADVFADLAAEGPWRFVILPTDKGEWSDEANRRLEATGDFRLPPTPFDGLLLYESMTDTP